jgi:NAD(P)-dependent dehydrogenase (short-subunit alcohol dehydrogenase family)
MFGLDGKVAVVIGGGGVLGGAMAQGLAKAGAKVAILSRTRQKAESQANYIKHELNGEAIAVQVDATNKDELQRAKNEILAVWPGIDVLVNASGTNSSTSFLDISDEEWTNILDVNLKSVFFACQVFGQCID